MNTCRACFQSLPASDFYASNKSRCKKCVAASVRLNRAAKIEYYRSYDRSRSDLPHRSAARALYQMTDEFRISHAVASKRWDVANAIRKRAQIAVNNAIRDGRLIKQPCFVCGSSAHAHHPDYSAPLAVSWLCPPHHAQVHKEHREHMRQAA